MQLSVHPQSSVREGGHCRSCGSSLRSRLRSDRNSDSVLTGRLCYAEQHSGCLTCQLMESSQHPKEVGSLTPGFAVRKPSCRALSHTPTSPAEVPARRKVSLRVPLGPAWASPSEHQCGTPMESLPETWAERLLGNRAAPGSGCEGYTWVSASFRQK